MLPTPVLPIAAALALLCGAQAVAWSPPSDVLVVLADTGTTCEGGLPRLTRHPDPSRHTAVLTRGYSGSLLRLYQYVQRFREGTSGAPVEPAYLLLSTTRGGFPRFGFCFDDEPKPEAGYVDLHRDGRISGRFGAMDQIFPHELLHVITRQLAGSPPAGGSNQIHAVGVRTDQYQAFNEGFAEHAQVMAVDDPDAAPDTAALVQDPEPRQRAWRDLDAYRRAILARWSLAPRHRLAFVFWFGSTEQALRYHAVKENLFAREPDVPAFLLESDDPWAAYLLENIMPGRPDAPFKASPRLVATEGVVAAAMTRWVTLPIVQRRLEEPLFYQVFGADRGRVTPIENAYLKLFRVLADARAYDMVSLARAYQQRYPDEAAAIESMLGECGIELHRDVPEIWLASARFETGTTLFDQYRGLRRTHTFDLNAASPADLASVRGLSRERARALQSGMPYAALDDLSSRGNVSAAVMDELRRMQAAFASLRTASEHAEESLSLLAVFRPSIWRAAVWIAVAAVAGAGLYRARRRAPVWRLAVIGLGAALFGLLSAWLFVAPWWFAPAVPLTLFGVPAVLWQLGRRRWAEAAHVATAWVLAVLPTVLIVHPLG